jgi:hypothetical protein
MQRLAYAGAVMAFRALWAFVLVLILLGMTAGWASAQTASPAVPDTPSQVPAQVPTPTITPPAMTWATIRQDTPEEREAFPSNGPSARACVSRVRCHHCRSSAAPRPASRQP